MLGTFSFEPKFRSYFFPVGPLNFSEFTNKSSLSHAAPPQPPGPTPTRAGALLPSPRCPGRAARPPHRRRHGKLGEEPRLPSSRVLLHQGNPRIPIPSFPRQFPGPNLQNTTTARPNAGELELTVAPLLHGRSTRADPIPSSTSLSRSSPASSRRLSSTRAPSPLSSSVPLRRRTSMNLFRPPRP